MSAEDDKFLLEEFVTWREASASKTQDLSPTAFLTERRHQANERRIEEAVAVLGEVDGVSSQNACLGAIRRLRVILEGDRPHVINSTIISAMERIYT
jgi:hypothetical protein